MCAGTSHLLTALICISLCYGCAVSNPQIEKLENNIKRTTVVLFVPGFKGSTLVDADGHTKWISPREALFGSTSLALPIMGLGLPEAPSLKVDKVLRSIVVIPWLFGFDAYKSFFDSLEERLPQDAKIQEFPYDWRIGNAQNSEKLYLKISELRRNGIQRIVLVGHSMGGVLVSYFLRYGSQPLDTAIPDWSGARLVDGVALIASPFKGSLSIFCDLQAGKKTAFNRTILSRESLGSFESAYELLPESSSIKTGSGIAKLYQMSFWSDNQLGLLNGDLTSEVRKAREIFLGIRLSTAERFRQLLRQPRAGSLKINIPVFNFVGVGFPVKTETTLIQSRNKCGSILYSDGDDTVTRDSATLPEPFASVFLPTVMEVKGHHADLLSTEPVLTAIVGMSRRP